jgi:ABC-type molybdate transport system permease subunit
MYLVIWFFSAAFIFNVTLEMRADGYEWRQILLSKIILSLILAPIVVGTIILNELLRLLDLELE